VRMCGLMTVERICRSDLSVTSNNRGHEHEHLHCRMALVGCPHLVGGHPRTLEVRCCCRGRRRGTCGCAAAPTQLLRVAWLRERLWMLVNRVLVLLLCKYVPCWASAWPGRKIASESTRERIANVRAPSRMMRDSRRSSGARSAIGNAVRWAVRALSCEAIVKSFESRFRGQEGEKEQRAWWADDGRTWTALTRWIGGAALGNGACGASSALGVGVG
jgi:hypothetical protein